MLAEHAGDRALDAGDSYVVDRHCRRELLDPREESALLALEVLLELLTQERVRRSHLEHLRVVLAMRVDDLVGHLRDPWERALEVGVVHVDDVPRERPYAHGRPPVTCR